MTGWTPKPEGWCRGAECIPASLLGDVAHSPDMTAESAAAALGSPDAVEPEHRIAVIGVRADTSATLASGVAPDVELVDLEGRPRRLVEEAHDTTLLVAFSSWCGCRHDLPGWKALVADGLAPDEFTIWRAGMQLVGDDPFGAEFFERYSNWQQRMGGRYSAESGAQ